MDEKTFKADVKLAAVSSRVDITLISKWFEQSLLSLKALHKQKAGIRHPRHRGDARETDLVKVLEPMFPRSIELSKGFVIERTTAHSREQDILLLDTATGAAVVHTDGCSYYPVEAVFGAIEVKSRLNLGELRKAILSCMSVKRLALPPQQKIPIGDIWYSLFAYESDWDLDTTAKRIDKAVADVPINLRPDAVYILGKGLLIPGSAQGLELKYRQDLNDGYQSLPSMGTELLPSSEAHAFLWFATSMIDHCLRERSSRKPPSLFSYVVSPLVL
ncbi:hypothetical protein V1291_004824 [Nitrobacteraceae bacterium AZCC 1564]